jgi:formylglycine-generating enzyme required for sulfatase activity
MNYLLGKVLLGFATGQERISAMSTANRRDFLKAAAALSASSVLAGWQPRSTAAADLTGFNPANNVIQPPDDAAHWPAFREALKNWREETKAKLQYSDALYRRPEFAWSASNYACCFLMMSDETFYDRRAGRYTVETLLDHGQREFGGYDSVVLWHAYPRIGLDRRNQFDFYRDMPGGLGGVRDVVRCFHERGVKVYIDYNPWDTGTRREEKSDIDMLVEMVAALEVDGIFLDTMSQGASEFRAKLDAVRPGVILEGEGVVPLENLHQHHASWAQGFQYGEIVGVLRHKWFERRHMQHQIERWNLDHSDELHAAWLNGSGMMIWENVFGSWVPWCKRDRSLLRSMLPIQRRFTTLLSGEGWTPLVPAEQSGVCASLWEGDGLRLWTLANRKAESVAGSLLKVSAQPGHRWFDLISGREVSGKDEGVSTILSGTISPRGIGCFLSAADQALGADFAEFLGRQSRDNARADLDTATPWVENRVVRAAAISPKTIVREGMVEVPAAAIELKVEMRQRECGFHEAKPLVQFSRLHSIHSFTRRVELKRYAIDETLVTNSQFAAFLKAADYKPKNAENFLKHWSDGHPPAGKEDHPVVFVDLDDARAYAAWAGKRLPTEEQWQYAAQGSDGRKYPWGETFEQDRCNAGQSGGTTPVKAFPQGCSPFGCYDMCGNVWQWTESERSNGRTRFCIIRGGSFYAAKGSAWYMEGGPCAANFAAKFLMMWPGLDRCETIGFRCAADLG